LPTTLSTYGAITRNLTRSLGVTAAKPQVARESAYYLANIGNVKSIDDLLGNKRLFSFAMKAFGLQDMTYAKAFMRKVLTEGIAENKTFANKLTDIRYRQFAAAFNFAALGDKATQTAAATTGTATQYVTQTMEEKAGDQNEGLRLALYFTRKASTITNSYQILADKAMTQVVQTALGLPSTISSADIDAQAKMITSKIKLTDFQDPAKVTKFVQRFAAMWDATQAQSDNSTNPALVLIGGAAPSIGMDTNVLTTLQNIKFNR
jgi:hypothetical protein